MRKTTKFLSLLLTAALVGSVIFSGSAVKVSAATTRTEQARLASTNGAEREASTYEKEGRSKNLSPDAVYSENGKIHLYANYLILHVMGNDLVIQESNHLAKTH